MNVYDQYIFYFKSIIDLIWRIYLIPPKTLQNHPLRYNFWVPPN